MSNRVQVLRQVNLALSKMCLQISYAIVNLHILALSGIIVCPTSQLCNAHRRFALLILE